MTTKRRFTSALSIATFMAGSWVAFAPISAGTELAVQTQHDHADATPAPKSDDTKSAPESNRQMMPREMMAHMKQGDDRLQTLVTAMNQATGNAKIAAMATLLAALADERRAMSDGMMQMQGQMTDMRKSMQEGMAGCPMMQHAPGKN